MKSQKNFGRLELNPKACSVSLLYRMLKVWLIDAHSALYLVSSKQASKILNQSSASFLKVGLTTNL